MAGRRRATGTPTAEPRQPRQPTITTTHPTHAVRGGLSLLILPLGSFMVLAPAGAALAYWWAAAQGMRWLGLLLFVCGGALAVAIFDHAQPRVKWERRRAAIAVAWLTVVFSWALVLGPSSTWFGVTEVTGMVTGWWWFFVKTEAVRGSGNDTHSGEDSFARAIRLSAATRAKLQDVTPDKTVIEVEHTENTHEDVQAALPLIEAKARFDAGSLRWTAGQRLGRTKAHLSVLTAWHTRHLDDPGLWLGPDRPGQGVWEPVDLGIAEDGKPSEWKLCPDEEFVGSQAAIISGMSGAAKTAMLLMFLGTLSSRVGVVVWGGDTTKYGVWVPHVRPALGWFEKTPAGIDAQLAALDGIVAYRSTEITALTGKDRWTPECWIKHRMPFLVYVIGEGAQIAGQLEERLEKGVLVWRSAGIKVLIEHQRPAEDMISTTFRNLVPESWAGRVDRPEDGRMALKKDTLDAGAAPWSITDKEPGTHYAEYSNEPRERWAMKRRTRKPNVVDVCAAVAQCAHTHRGVNVLDPGSAAAADAATGGYYSGRDVVTVGAWQTHPEWGRNPLLQDPTVQQWIRTAKAGEATDPDPEPPAAAGRQRTTRVRPDGHVITQPVPAQPAAVDSSEEDDMDDEPDVAPVVPTIEDGEIAEEARMIDEELEHALDVELGPDPEMPAPVTAADVAAMEADPTPAGFDWTPADAPPDPVPPPTPEQRAYNWQLTIYDLFQDPDLRERDEMNDRWVIRVDTERLVRRWRKFPGEFRTSIYPRLRAAERRQWARSLRHGVWLIAEDAYRQGLVIPDDYEPDLALPTEATQEDLDAACADYVEQSA